MARKLAKRMLSALGLCTIPFFISANASNSDLIKLSLAGENNIKVCFDQPDEKASCKLVSVAPAEGKVRSIVQGGFIGGGAISWLSLTDRKAAVCYLDGRYAASCEPLRVTADFSKYTVSYTNGRIQVSYPAQQDKKTVEKVRQFAAVFSSEVSAAATRLVEKLMAKEATAVRGVTNNAWFPEEEGLQLFDPDDPLGGDMPSIPIPGPGGLGGGGGGGCISGPGIVCIPGTAPPPLPPGMAPWEVVPPSNPVTPVDPPLPCRITGTCSAPLIPPPLPPDCRPIRENCRAQCADATLPTKPGNDGWAFYKCYNKCIEGTGC